MSPKGMHLRPEIVEHSEIGPRIRRLAFHSPELARAALPGQFAHVLCGASHDPLLRRPFSIHDADPDSGRVSLVYEIRGRGTALLAEKRVGDALDLLGPLGNGFALPSSGGRPIWLVGGGMGAAPLYLLARRIAETVGSECISFSLGARTAEMHICLDEFRCFCPTDLESRFRIATDDGSLGDRGLVSELLAQRVDEMDSSNPPITYACGPTVMLREVARIAKEHGLECQVSLEAKMACGVGACMGCVVKVREGGGYKYVRVCREGPVFEAQEVVWDE